MYYIYSIFRFERILRRVHYEKRKVVIIIIAVVCVVTAAIVCFFALNFKTDKFKEIVYTDWQAKDEFSDNSFMKEFASYSEFDVVGVEKDENCYILTCKVSSPYILDGLKEYQETLEDIPSEEDMNTKLINLITTSEMKTTEQVIRVYETDENKVVEYTDEFIDAMYGYAYLYSIDELQKMIDFDN